MTVTQIAYERSTHAPARKMYVRGEFQTIGDPPADGLPWRRHTDTGAEIHALGGPDHRYNRDLKVGSSYPETVFITADGETEVSVSHDELEAFLREHGLWYDRLNPVAVPRGSKDGEPWWAFGFQFRPPGAAPYSLDSIKWRVGRKFDLDEHELIESETGFRAYVW